MKHIKLNILIICILTAFSANAEQIKHDLQNSCSGKITLQTGSGFTFNWSNGETGNTIENLCAGDYTVTLSDNFGNSEIETYTIINFDEIPLHIEYEQNSLFSTEITIHTWIENNSQFPGTVGTPPFSYTYTSQGPTQDHINYGDFIIIIPEEL